MDVIDYILMFLTLQNSPIGIVLGIEIRPSLCAQKQSWLSFFLERHRQEDADNV